MDVTTLAVALIGVAGTLGGTLGGAALSQRASRAEAREQSLRTDRQREQERAEQAVQAKRDLYALLNTTARAYRIACRDVVEASARGEVLDPSLLDAAKEAWAEQYSLAQMTLAGDVLDVASSLNRSLGVGYSVVKQLPSGSDRQAAYRRATAWFMGPLSDGVYLLRVALRQDLGVEAEVEAEFERWRLEAVTALDSARNSLARQLEAERRPVNGSVDLP
ncbi:hypothetical protein [Streptomyces sp. NPDC087300]|uniref:hypothetical protein n=1 Tax=Streptomyces sp. NPDC087300 TaxID=3365780 RepID=UPI003815EDB6